MTKTFKKQITITDYKKGKILKKEITKKILACFNQTPKTASEIANSISFPKEKIYYHIKNLIANDILYIESKEIVKDYGLPLDFSNLKHSISSFVKDYDKITAKLKKKREIFSINFSGQKYLDLFRLLKD